MFNKRRTIPTKRVRKVVIGSTHMRYRDSVEVTRASGMKKAMKELRTEKKAIQETAEIVETKKDNKRPTV